ncbi:glutamine--fructose-6-phosphate transaminase (isomerizing) [Bacillaceae bacterium SIJ1]|uniref:glutamine--fructose-6-phosphate transaminase (isomerizing) n=1 Tax=Litoribacterium kuwaitense TaxID=1398745 RepID=UPI0013EE2966|nr:glutamine--fructose-6-phosphate transaminase (isomerizing) [Litoribacterium kuwaitense]NGP45679.1 glutamine--fructose-6-phosphate transaminase (isomerizing) [Litoribacterium kuwaitense]
MCGIVGYIGTEQAKDILLNGLERLEYRGYDSAGIALMNATNVEVYKEKGRIAKLRGAVAEEAEGTTGIGHTRWATHGVPSQENAHPHQSTSGRFTLVHNGVIENDQELKEAYLLDVGMKSETDTEVIVQLIEQFASEGLSAETAFRKTLGLLQGSYAIGLLDKEAPERILVAKQKSPLLIGLSSHGNVVASDAMATLALTDQYVEMMDGEVVILTKGEVNISALDGTPVSRAPYTAELDATDIEKGTYPHFMLKEIDEQPLVMRRIIQHYQDDAGRLKVDEGVRQAVKLADRLYIVACGTSWHAGLVGKQFLENIAGVPTEVHIASEFSYNRPLLSERPLFVFISQSGETADCRSVLVDVKQLGHSTLTITNSPGSTLSREADHTLLLHAGPEIAVASTKAYTAQIALLSILAVDVAQGKGATLDFDPLKELAIVANAMEVLCDEKDDYEQMARDYLSDTRNAFFIGRAVDYYVVMEAALKLKEISYIQAEGFAAGELKHGTIALIEDGTPVFGLISQPHVAGHLRGNLQEVAARGAHTCTIVTHDLATTNDAHVLPEVHPHYSPLASVVPFQLLAYYAALHRGCDVDKPRNLAKSVTVE